MFSCFTGFYGGNGGHTQRAEEKRNGFHLKGCAANDEIKNKQYPLGKHNAPKAHQDRSSVSGVRHHQKANAGKDLEHSQQQQAKYASQRTGSVAAQLCQPLLLAPGDRLQGHIDAANVNDILRADGANIDLLAVDQHTGFGIGVGDGPAAVIVPGDDRVIPGNCGKIDNDIAAFASADDIFPVGDGQFLLPCHTKPGPDLRFSAEGQQRFSAPKQQEKAKNWRQIPHNCNKNIRIGIFCAGKQIHNGFHTVTSLHSKNSHMLRSSAISFA